MMQTVGETTPKENRETSGREKSLQNLRPAWPKGQSGNPAGRPKGSRNRLSEDYVDDLYEDWKDYGKSTIARVREKNPEIYLQVVSRLVPKDVKIEVPQLERIAHVIVDVATSEALDTTHTEPQAHSLAQFIKNQAVSEDEDAAPPMKSSDG